MRWPFRRKADAGHVVGEAGARHVDDGQVDAGFAAGGPTAVAHGDSAGAGSSSPASAADAVVRPPARQWATLPAISVTIPRTSPLVVGPAPVVPLLRLGARGGEAGVVEPAVGTVTGLAAPVVRAPEPVVAQQVTPAPPLLVRRASRPAPAEVVPLVEAVDEYVGEPREPAEPHRAPAWLRFTPNWLTPGQPSIPGLPGPAPDLPLAEPPSFLPRELRSAPAPKAEPAPKPELPPRMEEGLRPAADSATPAMRRRRPSLGQTRRLGLGAPIPKTELVHPEEPPPTVDGTVDTPPSQEPPPPSAAPVRVATEPAPEPPSAPSSEPPLEVPAPPPHEEARPPEPARKPVARGPNEPPPGGGGRTPPARPAVATYRATPELRPPARRREVPRATVVDRVPVALANEVRARQQADVSAVPVYRGPKVTEAVKARGARAFASGGAVFLPDDVGPVDSPRAKGLLAHELVHAVQQRSFGGRLPAADSPLGRRLEAEAQAAERFYSGEAGAAEPPPLIHAPAATPAAAPEPDMAAAAQLATELVAAQPHQLHSPFDASTTAEVGRIATESARTVVTEWTNPVLHRPESAGTGQQGQHATGEHGTGQHPSGPHPATQHPGRPTPGTPQTPTFDTASRREQLVAAALSMRNSTLPPGASPVMQLTDEELNAIDRQVQAEAAQHGVPVAGTEPAAQRYEPNSAKAWMHAITGQNMNYGLGLTGFREPVGSERSWYGSEKKDDRPLSERLADQFGLINENTATQFDTDTWWQAPAPDSKGRNDDAEGTGADHPAQHEDNVYGRANPDRSSVDVNKIDLDELATRLYDRLRTRLRTELLVDRERAGLLTDFR